MILPLRPAHKLAMRSVDAKNPEGLGPPAFDRVQAAAEVQARAVLPSRIVSLCSNDILFLLSL
jgi:hypothetical protein